MPLALASGVGAEIPKPLAMVVIGGLLYAWMEDRTGGRAERREK